MFTSYLTVKDLLGLCTHIDVSMSLPPPDDRFGKSVTSQPKFEERSGRPFHRFGRLLRERHKR